MIISSVKIVVKHDEWPELSFIGEYTDEIGPGLISRQHNEYYDFFDDEQEKEIPCRGREYRSFRPYAGGEKPGTDDYYKYGMQDYERMEKYNRGDWHMVGVYAQAKVISGSNTIQTIRTGGLWGIESDSDMDYITQVANEQLDELMAELEAYNIDMAGWEDHKKKAIEKIN